MGHFKADFLMLARGAWVISNNKITQRHNVTTSTPGLITILGKLSGKGSSLKRLAYGSLWTSSDKVRSSMVNKGLC